MNLKNVDLALFALGHSQELGTQLARESGLVLSSHEEIEFEDGEHKIRPLECVRNKDVYILSSLYGEPGFSVNDKLCRLLFFIGAVRDAWAGRVTILVPYLCYSRKDRRSKERDPITSRYVAQLLESVGADRMVTMDVHNLSAFENAFRCPVVHLESCPLFLDYFSAKLHDRPLAVVSPDSGGVKRAEAFRTALEQRLKMPVSKGFVEKIRSDQEVWGGTMVGDVEGRTVILLDDLIASGTTMVRAAEACREKGATAVYGAATHGVFAEESNGLLENMALDKIVISDTVPPVKISSEKVRRKIEILPTAKIWAALLSGENRILAGPVS